MIRKLLYSIRLKTIIISLFILSINHSISAQKMHFGQYKNNYPKEEKIYLNRKKLIEIRFNEDRMNINTYTNEEVLFLKNNQLLQSKESIMYNNFNKIVDISACTDVLLSNGKYKTYKVDEFNVKDVLDNGIFHSDLKTVSFIFPNLTEGAITKVNYKNKISDPRFITGFVFNTYIIAENTEFSIKFPDNVEIGYTIFNDENIEINFTKKKSSKTNTYTWTAKNVTKIPFEMNSPNYRYYSAHIVIYIKGYTINDTRVRVLSDLDDLHSWYYNLTEKVNKESNETLKIFVDSLVRNESNEIDKIKKIFYWVQDNIRYIALEEGLGGFIPRNAEKVFMNRYGDCKDMSSIITKMLDMAGVESYLTWIGTREIPYSYKDVFTPIVDNHMIAACKLNNKVFFLDATGGYLPFELPSSFIQGKEALINLGEKNYEIVRIDEIDAERNKFIDTITMILNEEIMKGTGVAYYTGYYDVLINNLLREKTNEEQLEIVKNYFTKGNNKYRINNINVKNIGDREKNTIICYDFELQDYVTIIDDHIFINMNLDKSLQYNKIEESRKLDLEQNYKNITSYHTIFEIPDGYKVEYLPNDIIFENQYFSFIIDYEILDNKIALTHDMKINHLVLENSMFGEWNTMISEIQNAYSEVVLLKKSK